MEAYETFKVGPYTVRIVRDEDPQKPDEWGSDVVRIVTTRNRYFELNSKQLPDPEQLPELERTHWVFKLFMYAHSGVVLSLGPFSCPWDSGQVGLVLVSKPHANKDAEKSWRYRAKALLAARALVDEWNMYLSGDVWGYVITARAGDLDEDLEDDDASETQDVDSCWGFYGLEYCKEQARESAEWHQKHEEEQAAKIKSMMHV